jgi:hypothetical protein
MTAKKDFKRRVRERQARTGESYTTARAHVLAGAPERETTPAPSVSAIPVEEMIGLDEQAAALGYRCPVIASSRLLAVAEPEAVLARVRDVLLATEGDPATKMLRALALHGERPTLDRPQTPLQWERWWEETRRFGARLRAGIAGVTERGDTLALHVEGRAGSVFVLCLAGLGRALFDREIRPGPPRLFLTLADRQ